MYGGGEWPHYSAYQRNELASNGNYYEPDAIAVRHGICGDPEQVRCIIRYNTIFSTVTQRYVWHYVITYIVRQIIYVVRLLISRDAFLWIFLQE